MEKHPHPTQLRVKELLDYDYLTGVFRHKRSTRRISIGSVAGCVESRDGYRLIGIDRRHYKAHRLAWLYVHGTWPAEIDHINREADDNRISNLRVATRSQIRHNQGRPRHNTSGFKGVCWSPRAKKWRAYIMKDNRQKFLGHYVEPGEAHAAYCAAAGDMFGEFARGE